MFSAFLIPDSELRASGSGEVLELDRSAGLFLVTLGITRVVEQESIDVGVYGSPDGIVWPSKPLLAFPQKFYPGTSQLLLDLAGHAAIKFLRPQWTLNRWGRGDLHPVFGVYLFLQEQQR